MAVRIVTDSSADIPGQIVKDLGITVVPLYVRFGDTIYRDRVDITEDQFYQRLVHESTHPATIQPSPQDFISAYEPLCKKDNDSVLSIHISNKLSGTLNSAIQAREKLGESCHIDIIDSELLSMALGLIVIEAAKMAKNGMDISDISQAVRNLIPNVKLLGLLDTLKYLLLGGRIGKAKALLGSILNVKPLLTLKDGEVMPVGQVRSRSKGIDRLVDYIATEHNITALSVAYNTTLDEARSLVDRLKSYYKGQIYLARIGPMLGVHMGPGTLIVAAKTENKS